MAEGLRVQSFESKGRRYEIRAVAEGNRVVVRAYLEGEPATRFTYSVECDTLYDLGVLRELEAIGELMELARKDVFADSLSD